MLVKERSLAMGTDIPFARALGFVFVISLSLCLSLLLCSSGAEQQREAGVKWVSATGMLTSAPGCAQGTWLMPESPWGSGARLPTSLPGLHAALLAVEAPTAASVLQHVRQQAPGVPGLLWRKKMNCCLGGEGSTEVFPVCNFASVLQI